MSDVISPCPFCGGGAGWGYMQIPGRQETVTVSCGVCGSSGPHFFLPDDNEGDEIAHVVALGYWEKVLREVLE